MGSPHVVTIPSTAPHHGVPSLTDRSGDWSPLLSQPGGMAHQEGDRGHLGEEGGGASRTPVPQGDPTFLQLVSAASCFCCQTAAEVTQLPGAQLV